MGIFAMACKRVRDEFSLSNINFDEHTKAIGMVPWRKAFAHDPGRCFRTAQSYLIFRCLMFFLMFGTLIWSFYDMAAKGDGGYWFIYLTHWTLVLENVYLGVAAYVTSKYAGPSSKTTTANDAAAAEDNRLPCIIQVMWLLNAIVLPASFFVFVLYWGLVFSGELKVLSCLTHGLNFVVMALDSAVGSMPYLLLHGIWFMLYCLVFLLWSVLHYLLKIGDANGNGYIYSSLDWGSDAKGVSEIAMLIVLVAAPFVNCVFWVAVNLINDRCCINEPDPSYGPKTEP
jgi:hypothetical protein